VSAVLWVVQVSAVLVVKLDMEFKLNEQVFELVVSLTKLNLRKSRKVDREFKINEQLFELVGKLAESR
jgi:hypothetical protein